MYRLLGSTNQLQIGRLFQAHMSYKTEVQDEHDRLCPRISGCPLNRFVSVMFFVGQEVTRCNNIAFGNLGKPCQLDPTKSLDFGGLVSRVILPQQVYFTSFQKLGAWQSIVIHKCKHLSVILSKFKYFKTLTIIYTPVIYHMRYLYIVTYTHEYVVAPRPPISTNIR